jgi:hypothetical protein
MNTRAPAVALALVLTTALPALGDDSPLVLMPVGAALAQTPASPAVDTADPRTLPAPVLPGFGEAGYWGLTLSTGYAYGFDDAHSLNPLSVAVSTFVAADLEVRLELGGWVFLQADSDEGGEDTGGVSLALSGRWHFWKPAEGWTVYADAGAGLNYSGSDIPANGSEFNFNPRAGAGFTVALDDSARAARLDIGLRWHHLSNARIFGGDRNEARDSVMIYAGVTFAL